MGYRDMTGFDYNPLRYRVEEVKDVDSKLFSETTP